VYAALKFCIAELDKQTTCELAKATAAALRFEKHGTDLSYVLPRGTFRNTCNQLPRGPRLRLVATFVPGTGNAEM